MIDPRASAVAARAVELARARRIDLSDDLALWRLAGGRPDGAARSGDPGELGALLEQSHDATQRRRHGVHYTPTKVAAPLVERAVRGHRHPTVGDPACGGGALLLEAAAQLADRGEDPVDVVARLFGADVDPLAVATTEAALWLWAGARPPAGNLVVADTLLDDLEWPPLDVVVGNPPFLSQLSRDTTRAAAQRTASRERYGDAMGAYTDTAALFLLRSLELVGPAGRVALLQPLSILGARDAEGVRTAVSARAGLEEVWFPPPGSFDADVDVCVPVLTVAETIEDRPWSAHLARHAGVPEVALPSRATVADEAVVTAGFRTEFYGLAAHVHEDDELPDGRRLATTRLIDLGRCTWGERPARIAGRTWQRPVVDVHALDGRAASWVERTAHPKLIVATQTRVIEVVVDREGDLVPGVPLIAVMASADRLTALAAAVASPAVTAWAFQRVAGTAMSAGALKLTAPLLREVPLPTDADAWQQGAAAFEHGHLEGFVEAMAVAYDVGPEVGEWWIERARSVWSPAGVPR